MWDRRRYPPNWEEIALSIKERAGWCCEWCGVAHGTWRKSRKKAKPYKVVMAVAHLGVPFSDGRPGNRDDKWDVRPENLACLCQSCHRRYDNQGRSKQSKQAQQPHEDEAAPHVTADRVSHTPARSPHVTAKQRALALAYG